ncbi:tRNA 2-thiouridine(34) synthase MnmA [Thermocrinis jamiesonii]|uniref:tRNA 2-thiouridine(34) synthase MnmA n=1 Tax=Thermocrinis jamiesonii TaxID=1302351 RepID=UPI0004971B85|nr:tRNA 2-thiouridine(34) synthase MnmA [Thermocrinis jamiesonii]
MSGIKALALLSGGLDSSLAIKLIQEQGIQVYALHFYTGFCITEQKRRLGIKREDGSPYVNPALRAAVQLGVPLEIVDISDEYFEVVLNPKYGYGANVNPCIDCRIMMLRKAKEIMQERGYHFVITGEVLGQRPMSQMFPTLRLIEKESGLEGYILRPLSAKLLPPTIPENLGWVDREKLLGIRGRGRKVQIELAKKYNLEYEQPAGGCCYLTDPNYALKFKEALSVEGSITREDLVLLSVGRHLRLPSGAKLIVARNEGEVNFLKGFINRYGYAKRQDNKGTLVLIKGLPTEEEYPTIAGVVCRYSKREPAEVLIKIGDKEICLWAEPLSEEILESFKIIKEKVHGVE